MGIIYVMGRGKKLFAGWSHSSELIAHKTICKNILIYKYQNSIEVFKTFDNTNVKFEQ